MATGDTLAKFSAISAEPALNSSISLRRRNGHFHLRYDGAVNQLAIMGDTLLRAYSGGGLTVNLHVSLITDITGTTDWLVAFENIGDQVTDVDVDSFAPDQLTAGTTVPGTSGLVQIIPVVFTDGAQIDNIAVGGYYRLRITRDAVNDTATGFAELYRIEIVEN